MRRFACLAVAVVAAVVVLMTGCTSESTSDKVQRILATVPGDVAAVGVVDAGDLLEKLGATPDGEYFKPGAELEAFASKNKVKINDFIGGKAGVDPEVLVFYTSGQQIVLTGFLADEKKFKEYMKAEGSIFASKDGVDVTGSCCVKGDRFWLFSDTRDIVAEVNRCCSLKESESMAASAASVKIEELDNDIALLMNLAYMSKLSGGYGLGFAQSMIYNDAETAVLTIDFEKGKIEGECKMYDSKGNEAKMLLDYGKVDTGMLSRLPANAKIAGALSMPHATVSKIFGVVRTMLAGMAIPEGVYDLVESIDGTLAFGVATDSPAFRGDFGCALAVEVDGSDVGAGVRYLQSLLSTTGLASDVNYNDGVVSLSVGNLSAGTPSDLSKYYDYLDGSAGGVLVDLGFLTATPELGVLKVRSVVNGEKEAEGEMELTVGSESQNSALTILKIINSKF